MRHWSFRVYSDWSDVIILLLLHLHGQKGPVSTSHKTSYFKISQSLEAAWFVFIIVRSLWNVTSTSAAVLPMCLSNFKAIKFQSDRAIFNTNLAVSRLCEILHVLWDIKTGPWYQGAQRMKQGKSGGFDSCDRPSNLTQIRFKSSIFQPVWPWKLIDDLEKL